MWEMEGIDRFRGMVSDEIIETVESYRYIDGFEWLNGMIEYLEDVEQLYELVKSIKEQVNYERKYGKEEEGILTEEEEEEMMEESVRKAEKYEEEYRKEQEESKALIKGLLY